MAVNFDKLPDSNPTDLLPAGYYQFTVAKAEMKQPKDLQKPPYLNVTLALTNAAGARCGTFFDIFTESTAAAVMYKLNRFCKAMKLNLTGNVELKDIAKVIPGKPGVVEIEQREDKNAPGGPAMRNQVKLFGSECYWAPEAWKDLVAGAAGTVAAAPAEDVPFNFSDEDAPPAAPVNNEY